MLFLCLCISLLSVFNYVAEATVIPKPNSPLSSDVFIEDLHMPEVLPTKHDEYICSAKQVDDERESYIVQYEVHSDNNKAHHVMLFGCEGVKPKNLAKGYWKCSEGNICSTGSTKIMFAWAKNAPPTYLPKDVGFRVGGKSGVNFLVLEVHYAHPLKENDTSGIFLHTTYERQKYIAGIFLLLAQTAKIPPLQSRVHADINCLYKSKSAMYPFAYRVHAHTMGVVISGYTYNTKTERWAALGKGNPQWPQAFYPMSEVHKIDGNDILAARCTFNSSTRNRWTYMGNTAADEMCNFYILYYTDAEEGSPFGQCTDAEYPGLIELLPSDSDVPLPRNPLLEEHALGVHSHHPQQIDKKGHGNHHAPSSLNYYSGDYSYEDKSSENPKHIASSPLDNDLSPHRGHVHHNSNINHSDENKGDTPTSAKGKSLFAQPVAPTVDLPNLYKTVDNWSTQGKQLGQITAVAFDSQDNVVIFHRGKQVWNANSFDVYNRFRLDSGSIIQENTIIVFNQRTGKVISEWGSNLFYMPHGLTIDKDDNLWITDVALHQIMKFPHGKTKASLTLGVALEPGNDDDHFCKPTSVAITKTGEFFVADGYCNNRILKYSADGKLMLQWGKQTLAIFGLKVGTPPPYSLNIPHKLALAEDKGLICVADRENGRIQCFSITNGTFHCQIHPVEFGDRLFAIAYTPAQGGLLYAVNGPSVYGDSSNIQGFVVNLTAQNLVGVIRPTGNEMLYNPHDITVSSDAYTVFIGEIGPNKLWKFVVDAANTDFFNNLQIINNKKINRTINSSESTSELSTDSTNLVYPSETNGTIKASISNVNNTLNQITPPVIIITLIAIPFLLMIFIIIVVKLRKQGKFYNFNIGHVKGWMTGYKQPNNDRFNLGNFLQPHKGFDRISMEESDGELDGSDSDVEEYSANIQKA